MRMLVSRSRHERTKLDTSSPTEQTQQVRLRSIPDLPTGSPLDPSALPANVMRRASAPASEDKL